MMRISIEHIGLMAPGMAGWDAARPVLRGEQAPDTQTLPAFWPNLLPPNERRRTTALIKLALQAAEDALRHSPYALYELASVFASSEGDGEVVDRICQSLTLPDRPVSPTHFHNSVHNAPAGYWAIASGSRQFSTSLAAGADTFAAGLLEAATVAILQQRPVLLLSYDYALPPALAGRGYVDTIFGVALLLSAQASDATMGSLQLELKAGTVVPPILPAELAELREYNPAAAALPLLIALARAETADLALPCHDKLTLQIGIDM
ncbi:beta-ketoacyl synthase chain length factor [Thiohalophilus sp.]|uniref:beta-ketoacyl synthase chain length factor n=1 Tax=Thiohalophilus sp. TaxID=3028392 RepID=UPI002ACE58F1|nr:beta-ketoacyl synthase chain length factor [Thiohalophilus sp.]MDZ7663098.1 beta-ketoacyl synthase chain length factor [Thiohalophilus sp.]